MVIEDDMTIPSRALPYRMVTYGDHLEQARSDSNGRTLFLR
jgi:hypothetical protein